MVRYTKTVFTASERTIRKYLVFYKFLNINQSLQKNSNGTQKVFYKNLLINVFYRYFSIIIDIVYSNIFILKDKSQVDIL